MMRLTTNYIGDIDGIHILSWGVGATRRGLIHIADVPDSDASAIAELVAIRYLLFIDNVFDRVIQTGKGIAIDVSIPVVKKAARGKTSKQHLSLLARYFETNLAGVVLGDTRKSDGFLPNPGDDVPETHISKNDVVPYDVIHTTAMGDIRITKHAIEKFTKSLNSEDLKAPLTSMIGRLKHEGISLQALPEKVIKHKLKKYGTVENLETWGHDSSQMHFTVTRDKKTGVGTVVTCFKRHSDH